MIGHRAEKQWKQHRGQTVTVDGVAVHARKHEDRAATYRPISHIEVIDDMKTKNRHINLAAQHADNEERVTLPGYPLYPASEDIFNRSREETSMNPEDTSMTKDANEKAGKNNEKDFSDDVSGGDLDVPGSELDDEQESIGSEDEENNLYSLGGDAHDD